MSLEIVRIPVLSDNYVWLVHEPVSGDTTVIDPSIADPVLEAAAARGWTIGQIWNTHWHPDHTGGNEAIKAATGCRITGPAAEADRIPTLDRLVGEGDSVALGDISFTVMEVPAHTAGHIAYYSDAARALFCGDTLFAMGCGRLFEGTAAQMFDAMQRFLVLPPDTSVYCAHEYTLSNAHFAVTVEPDNEALADRYAAVKAARDKGEATVPTTIALELATNPFMRANDVAELAERRSAKDAF